MSDDFQRLVKEDIEYDLKEKIDEKNEKAIDNI